MTCGCCGLVMTSAHETTEQCCDELRVALDTLLEAAESHVLICTGDDYDFEDLAVSVGALDEVVTATRKSLGASR